MPIILVGNISPDGRLDLLQDACFVEDDFFDANRERASVHPLDILIAKDGATTGKVGLVPFDFDQERCLINEHIFKLTVGPTLPGDVEPGNGNEARERQQINTWYVFFFLKSWLGQQQVNREVSGGAQGGITKAFVRNIRVPIPPLDERQRFVDNAKAEYEQYLALDEQANAQHRRFMDSLGGDMHRRGEPESSATQRIIRRL